MLRYYVKEEEEEASARIIRQKSGLLQGTFRHVVIIHLDIHSRSKQQRREIRPREFVISLKAQRNEHTHKYEEEKCICFLFFLFYFYFIFFKFNLREEEEAHGRFIYYLIELRSTAL